MVEYGMSQRVSEPASSEAQSGPYAGAVFTGGRPASAGDMVVEAHGIAPIPESGRYGRPARLFSVWFAPQVNLTGVFIGTLAMVLGLGFWLGLVAMFLGTVLGATAVGVLSMAGPRTGAPQLLVARMAFGGGVLVPAALQGALLVARVAVVNLFGGQAISMLLGMPFWAAVLILLGVQAVVGVLGYEYLVRMQAVLSVLLLATFVALAVKLIGGIEGSFIAPAAATGADLVGAFVLEVTIAFSLVVSWAPCAADFSRYLPSDVSGVRVLAATTAGVATAYVLAQGLGIVAADVIGEFTIQGVRSAMGDGSLAALALLFVAVGTIAAGAMNVYSGSLALQVLGVELRRPLAALLVAASAFPLAVWLQAEDVAQRFTDVLVLVGYWIPAFVVVVAVDWLIRVRGRQALNPTLERVEPGSPAAALAACGISYVAAMPFMNNVLVHGSVATHWYGADIGYFVSMAVAAAIYGGYRAVLVRAR